MNNRLAGQPIGRLILILPLLAFLLRLGGAPLFDLDEGAFSEATREMFDRGDFLFTYLNGEPRFDKPILIYWLQAASVSLFGVTELAFRLPSALAAIAWCYATWMFARPRIGEDGALLALAVASTAIGPFVIGRAATADGLLNCLLALTLFDAWRHLESGRRAPLLRVFMWMGLGALAKGPVAIIVPGAVTFLYCASRGEWGTWLKAVFNPLGWLILVAIAGPWYAYAYLLHGQAFIDGFLMRHNVERFSGSLEGHSGGILYYVVFVPLLLMPWTGLLGTALARLRGSMENRLQRFLWIWFGFVLVFFSISGTKLPHYVLYGITPLFLLIAVHRESSRRSLPHLIWPTLLLALMPALPQIFDHLSRTTLGEGFFRDQMSRALEVAGTGYFIATFGVLVLWLALAVLWRTPPWRKLVLAGILQVVVLAAVVVPYVGELAQGPVKAAGLLAAQRPEKAVLWNFSTAASFSVYRQAVTPLRDPLPGELALCRTDRLPAGGVEVLFRQGGVVLARKLP
ncbi:MAG: glycosyltransferase family 39 protein [Zoogloea sp.]|nr:glycosyltransferase family 39 protein [Zoogloea sp.]